MYGMLESSDILAGVKYTKRLNVALLGKLRVLLAKDAGEHDWCIRN